MKDLVKVAAQNLVGIFLDIDIPEASRKVDLAEFGINVSALPAAALVEIEGAKLIDPADLRVFRTIKQRMWRAYSMPGLRFMGGRAMSKASAVELCKRLEESIAEANTEKASFISSFHARAKAWAEKHPQYEDALKKALSNVGNIGSRIKFDYVPFPIGTLSDEDSPMNAKIETQILGLADELFIKNAARATEIWQESFQNEKKPGEAGKPTLRSAVRASCLKPIRDLRDNFVDLAFIDDRAEPVVTYINHVLDALPPEGPYEGAELNSLQMLLLMLGNADMTKQTGEMLRDGKSCVDADAFIAPFLGFSPKKAIAVPVAQVAAPVHVGSLFSSVDVSVVGSALSGVGGLVMPTPDVAMPAPATQQLFSIPVYM